MNPANETPTPIPAPPERTGSWLILPMVPWTVSVMIHAGIVSATFLIVWSATSGTVENNVIPEAVFSENPTPEALVQTQNIETAASQQAPAAPLPAQQATQTADPLGELSSAASANMPMIDLSGSKPLPPAEKPSAQPLQAQMFGVSGDAVTIVYCVDASGSLVGVFDYVREELKASLRKLAPPQRFTVIFFQEDRAIEVPVPHEGLKRATRQNIKAVADWISEEAGNINPEMSSNPMKAIRLGMSYQPQLMFILSDEIIKSDRTIDQNELLEEIDRAKRKYGAGTKINTIQFIYPDEMETLKIIAQRHGGRYRFVDERAAEQPADVGQVVP